MDCNFTFHQIIFETVASFHTSLKVYVIRLMKRNDDDEKIILWLEVIDREKLELFEHANRCIRKARECIDFSILLPRKIVGHCNSSMSDLLDLAIIGTIR